MNLMSVDIPSKAGKPWGKIALIESTKASEGSQWLRVLIFLDLDVLGLRRVFTATIEESLQKPFDRFYWLVLGKIGFGGKDMRRPIRNANPALSSSARKVGKSLDSAFKGDIAPSMVI